jgi:hypothetical protein
MQSYGLADEKEAEKTAARTGASIAAVPSKAEPSKPPKPSEAEPEDELESESSSSGEEQTDEEGGFWIPPPGARRDEDREEELAEGGEDVVMGEAGKPYFWCGNPFKGAPAGNTTPFRNPLQLSYPRLVKVWFFWFFYVCWNDQIRRYGGGLKSWGWSI